MKLLSVTGRCQLLDKYRTCAVKSLNQSLVKSNFFLWPAINWQKKLTEIKMKNLTFFCTNFHLKKISWLRCVTSSNLRKSVIWIRFFFTESKKCQISNMYKFRIFNYSQGQKSLKLSPFLCFDFHRGGCKAETESTHARTELAWLAGFSWHSINSTQSALCQKLKTV